PLPDPLPSEGRGRNPGRIPQPSRADKWNMNLPNYFLADLPPEASVSATMVTEACQAVKRNRERYLATRSTQSIINALSSLAKNWLEAGYPFRKLALEQGPA